MTRPTIAPTFASQQSSLFEAQQTSECKQPGNPPVVPLALGLLREGPALAVIELFAAHVAAGGGANREGDEREEVLRNKHGGGAALRRTGAALSEVECRFSRESESSKS